MPISTMWEMRSPASTEAACTWERISEGERLRANPLWPVAQKLQFILHPTWVEMQMEVPWW